MINITPLIEKISDNTFVVMGLGKEGLSTYNFLRKNFPSKQIYLLDEKSIADLSSDWKKIEKTDKQVTFTTQVDEKFEDKQLLVFKTPGIPVHNQMVIDAQELKAEFTSNTNLFFSLVKLAQNQEVNIKTIGVTGTKGKSTTTSAIHHILSSSKVHSLLGGNIGTPPLSLWSDLINTAENNQTQFPVFAVLELSSHQLSDLKFSPNFAVVLDITPEHLDYYKDFNEYMHAKAQICRFQTESDTTVYNSEQYLPAKIAHLSPTKKHTFSQKRNIVDNWIQYQSDKIVDLDSLAVVGQHTVTNLIPGVVIAKEIGLSGESIATALQTFKPLPHRLEIVGEHKGVSYYNDSLSTTPIATIAALQSFKNRPIILIAGGFDRGLDYSELAQAIIDHQVKHVILLPDTGEIILEEIQKRLNNNMGEIQFTETDSLDSAVHTAQTESKPGDVVLLSPASASFNLFKNYAERGDEFRRLASQS
jgi:UDP-N-acetylmuramoylalanine--D-glutamate ligase